MTDDGHNKEALALDALGALGDDARRALGAHLAACPACRRERDELEGVAASLAHTVAPVTPPAELRARILDSARALKLADANGHSPDTNGRAHDANGRALGDTSGRVLTPPPERFTRRGPRRSWVVYGAIAAGVILSILSFDIFKLWRENASMREEMARLSREVDESREELARANDEAARERALADVLAAPGARVVTLAATKDAPQRASARLAFDDASGRAVLVASGLPPAPEGKAYQIWYIASGRPVPGRLFKTDAEGRGTLRDEVPADGRAARTFAVTLEPERGVTAPTGQILLSAAT
ncbi:MAG TPA: anti-sigma factor [Pyrinomonadaceae bacterium]|nr:anti-sigma factor [Pyrinomonadaceae bacterium]